MADAANAATAAAARDAIKNDTRQPTDACLH